MQQRRTIERSYRIGPSQGQIASIIGRDKSTVSRELARSFSAPGSRSPLRATARGGGAGVVGLGTGGVYDAERAQRFAHLKARRPKPRRLDPGPLRDQVWEDWPKGADLRHLTQTDCDDVVLGPNTRPRKTLDWQSPGQALNTRLVATTG